MGDISQNKQDRPQITRRGFHSEVIRQNVIGGKRMSWGFVAAGAATVVSGYLNSKGGEKAADAAAKSGDQAIAFQRELLQTSIDLSRPQLEVANGALGLLAGIFGIDQPSAIDFDNLGGGQQLHSLYGDGDTPLSEEGLKQAYRDVLGREADAGGLNHYLTRGPREGGDSSGIETGKIGPVHYGAFTGRDKPGSRRSFTFNEFLKATQGSDEFAQKQANGTLPEQRDFLAPASSDAQTGAPGTGLNLNELVADNPLIKFNREQGEQSLERGAAARGLNQSGGTLKDLSSFNQSLASTGVQQFVLDPLFQLAGFGPQASGQINNTANQTGSNLSNIALNTGTARGSAYQNSYNGAANSVNDLGQSFYLNQLLKNGGRG
ncbi:MAG: hypothetical protein ACPGSC_09270 [Granulosicoccaceae bacterium]